MNFHGFHHKVRHTPVPDPMFSTLLEKISDIVELKCTLRVMWLLRQKRIRHDALTLNEIISDRTLIRSISSAGKDPQKEILRGMNLAVDHGIFCKNSSEIGDTAKEEVYTLNTVSNRSSLSNAVELHHNTEDEIKSQLWDLPHIKPNIFGLYEDNIGMLSPIISEELKEAEEIYPLQWIEDAFREAVVHNKRSWKYVAAILERWHQEGRNDGKPIRGTQKSRYY